jgi:membrane associated rhomboid family serine protease
VRHGRELRRAAVVAHAMVVHVDVVNRGQVIDVLSFGQLTLWGELSIDGIRHGQVWRMISFQLLHGTPIHLIFNMLWLYFLGGIVEGRTGKPRFLAFYLLCGLAGGAAFVLMWAAGAPWVTNESSLVGASAGVFGIFAATVYLAPGMRFRIWFVPVTLTLRALMCKISTSTFLASGRSVDQLLTQGRDLRLR